MRFLKILIFFEGVFLVSCSVKNRKALDSVIEGENCPDADLQEECDSLCRLEFNQCRLLCETELCQSLCSEEYQRCRDDCPCGANCEEGCFNCENPICPVNDKHILVIGKRLSDAFTVSFDGSTLKPANISASSNYYTNSAPHALLKNELFIFGGTRDRRKIAKLVGCEWREEPSRLINPYDSWSAALSIEYGSKALICFPADDETRKCEVFDPATSTSTSTYSSIFPHYGGMLGLYQGQPTTVGNDGFEDNTYKVETLSSSGWSSLPDFPTPKAYHVLMGLPSGSLLLAGGRIFDGTALIATTKIWLLQNDTWKVIGDLQNADWWGSGIMIDSSIFIVSGLSWPHAIERLDLQGDELINQDVIEYTEQGYRPVLYEVDAGFCV